VELMARDKTQNQGRDVKPDTSQAGYVRFNAIYDSGALADLTQLETKCLFAFLRHADNATGIAYPGVKSIAAKIGATNLGRVRAAIRGLENKGLIETIDRGGKGLQDTAVRRVLAPRGPVSGLLQGAGERPDSRPVSDAVSRPVSDDQGAGERPVSRPVSGPRTTQGTTQGTTQLRTTQRTTGVGGLKESEAAQVEIEPTGFDKFWAYWPNHPRKSGDRARADAHAVWIDQGLEPRVSDIGRALRQFMQCAQWTNDNGKYIPAPANWLRDRKWMSPPPPPPPKPDKWGFESRTLTPEEEAAFLIEEQAFLAARAAEAQQAEAEQ
jgi:hypothetical protein